MGKIKRWFLDLPLRRSFACCVVLFAALAVELIVITAGLCSAQVENIYEVHMTDGKRYYLTTDQGERLGEGVVVSGSTLLGDAEAQRRELFFGLLPVVAAPVYIALCLFGAAALFYRCKLRGPLAQLNAAAARIARSDLDFTVSRGSQDELGQLCASFETMRAALEQNQAAMWRQIEQRRQLNAAFAHDLRTPLTVLKGYSETLQLCDDAQVRHTAAVMARQVERLERYTDSMSRLQRLEDAAPALRMEPAQQLADSLRRTAGMVCAGAGCRLQFSAALAPGKLCLDTEFFAQIADNLLANAARYAAGQVTVTLAAQRQPAGEMLILTVADDGPGFTPNALRQAAQPYFSEAEDRAGHFGLGLYMCRLLCEQHGGSLTIGNGTGGGACVTARLALGAEPTG